MCVARDAEAAGLEVESDGLNSELGQHGAGESYSVTGADGHAGDLDGLVGFRDAAVTASLTPIS